MLGEYQNQNLLPTSALSPGRCHQEKSCHSRSTHFRLNPSRLCQVGERGSKRSERKRQILYCRGNWRVFVLEREKLLWHSFPIPSSLCHCCHSVRWSWDSTDRKRKQRLHCRFDWRPYSVSANANGDVKVMRQCIIIVYRAWGSCSPCSNLHALVDRFGRF